MCMVMLVHASQPNQLGSATLQWFGQLIHYVMHICIKRFHEA